MRGNGHAPDSSRAVILELARLRVGVRMSARLVGCSVAWVAQVRKEAAISYREETSADVLAGLPDDLRRRIASCRAKRLTGVQ